MSERERFFPYQRPKKRSEGVEEPIQEQAVEIRPLANGFPVIAQTHEFVIKKSNDAADK